MAPFGPAAGLAPAMLISTPEHQDVVQKQQLMLLMKTYGLPSSRSVAQLPRGSGSFLTRAPFGTGRCVKLLFSSFGRTPHPKTKATRLRPACGMWLLLMLLLTVPAVAQAQFTFVTNNGAITKIGR